MDQYSQARNIALILLQGKPTHTMDEIEQVVDQALSCCPDLAGVRNDLVAELQSLLNIWVPAGSELVDPTGHLPWLVEKRDSLKWGFWTRYRTYLEQHKGFSPLMVDRLGMLTDSILEKLEDPDRSGTWDRRGMVVGQIQSGKTANYTGLICKAADAGYKLIIVLAGLHNNLRSQTQVRLDEGFLGRDTRASRAYVQGHLFGAGRIPTAEPLRAASLTNSAENGDFSTHDADKLGIPLGGDPVLLVIKKNKTVLDNLLRWVRATVPHSGEGDHVIHDIPLLLLDDEADNASINTNPLQYDDKGGPLADQDVTAINGLIRKLLKTFDKSAYVGYTATPFANIFIYPEGETDEHGEDLFPRSFIINLPAPSNYCGPVQVFGLERETERGREREGGLPIVREVADHKQAIPASHKSSLNPSVLPESLKEAMRAFILTCAARRARGQECEHNSMLVHVTRFVAVQNRIADLVLDELLTLQRRIAMGDGKRTPTLLDELKEQWASDFVPTTARILAQGIDDPWLTPLTWDEVRRNLKEAAAKIAVKTVNGYATDVLDYVSAKEKGLNVIAVGGDKLARGLTLEGLSVSYYLRASRMYDTLMQMGRWFGYRPGYLDLCRLYTSAELVNWYKHITVASEELREEFDRMALAGLTPMDFGLKVQTHPGGMTVTGAGKMRTGTKMRVSFAMSLAETSHFQKNETVMAQNFSQTETFLNGLKLERHSNGIDLVCEDVAGDDVARYLGELIGHSSSRSSDPAKLKEYIQKKTARGELVNWTVVVVNKRETEDAHSVMIGDHRIILAQRSQDKDVEPSPDTFQLPRRHIISRGDEALDLTPEQWEAALQLTREAWAKQQTEREEPEVPTGKFCRQVRQPECGLLLIYLLDPQDIMPGAKDPFVGFAVSFPETRHRDEAVEYLVNNVYWKEEFDVA